MLFRMTSERWELLIADKQHRMGKNGQNLGRSFSFSHCGEKKGGGGGFKSFQQN